MKLRLLFVCTLLAFAFASQVRSINTEPYNQQIFSYCWNDGMQELDPSCTCQLDNGCRDQLQSCRDCCTASYQTTAAWNTCNQACEQSERNCSNAHHCGTCASGTPWCG